MRINKPRRLFPALAAAVATVTVPAGMAIASQFRAVMSGENLTPRGDPDGWGRARVRVDDTMNLVCVDLEVRSLGQATEAHIHRGGEGVTGMPVVNLDVPGPNGDDDAEDCDDVGDALADEIQANPGAFYADVHTADHPEGALRGQLAPSEG